MTRIRRKDTLMTDYTRIRVFANDVVSENSGRQSGFRRRPEPLHPRGCSPGARAGPRRPGAPNKSPTLLIN
jgi:hypothetical protein